MKGDKTLKRAQALAASAAALLLAATAAWAETPPDDGIDIPVGVPSAIHVDPVNGDDANDGRYWNTAKKTLWAGLNAFSGSTNKVVLKKGYYRLDAQFESKYCGIYGGFDGDETREWQADDDPFLTIVDCSHVPEGQPGGIKGYHVGVHRATLINSPTHGLLADWPGVVWATLEHAVVAGCGGDGVHLDNGGASPASARVTSSIVANNGGNGVYCRAGANEESGSYGGLSQSVICGNGGWGFWNESVEYVVPSSSKPWHLETPWGPLVDGGYLGVIEGHSNVVSGNVEGGVHHHSGGKVTVFPDPQNPPFYAYIFTPKSGAPLRYSTLADQPVGLYAASQPEQLNFDDTTGMIFARHSTAAIHVDHNNPPATTYDQTGNWFWGNAKNVTIPAGSIVTTGATRQDPKFVMDGPDAVRGAWESVTYDPETNRTTLVDEGAAFAGGLRGRCVNPNTDQNRQFLIWDNTATSMVVVGDVAVDAAAAVGSAYVLVDYRLQPTSPAIDSTGKTIDEVPGDSQNDVTGTPRNQGGIADPGAYEAIQQTSGVGSWELYR